MQEVAGGDLLCRIEDAPCRTTLATLQADLAPARASLNLAEVEFARKKYLYRREVGTEADRDVAAADLEVARAQVQVAEAAGQRFRAVMMTAPSFRLGVVPLSAVKRRGCRQPAGHRRCRVRRDAGGGFFGLSGSPISMDPSTESRRSTDDGSMV